MATRDGRFVLVYNGEIYNYLELRDECLAAGISFTTQTDTEVLLACWTLWGEEALRRLNGMFAFVLVDREEAAAWLVRDPFGIKPLHYAMSADSLLVCSEIRPIVATGEVAADVDPIQSFEYIRFGASANDDRTLLSAVRKLPAASIARFDFTTGELDTPRRYWKPAHACREIAFPDAVAECRELFLRNVRLHLRSDVPVGAALSGGLDSSAIVCAVKHLEPQIRLNTFSFISASPAMSEERWVDLVTEHVDARAHKVRPEPTDLANDLEALVRAQGEPFGSASIYAQYRVFRMARENGVPVTLDGQGADELLGGYWPYIGTVGGALLRKGHVAKLARLILNAAPQPSVRSRLAAQAAQAVAPMGAQRLFRQLIGRSVVPPFFKREWLDGPAAGWKEAAAAHLGAYGSLREHLEDTLTRTSLPTLLRYADRCSMAFSVESRVPFLTVDLAEFFLSLPSEYIISPNGNRKHVFREAMAGIVPEEVRNRRDKIGFVADDALWLRQNWDTFSRYEDQIAEAPPFDVTATLRYLHDFRDGRHESAQQVWRIFAFAMWREDMLSTATQHRCPVG